MDKALQFPGRVECLDHADQGAHRHAGDRHPHAVGRQGHGQGPQGHREARPRDRGERSRPCRGTSSAFAERIIGGYYLEIEPDRTQLARYGLMVGDVQQVIASAIGAETMTTTVEGRERYAVSLRYPRDVRSDPQAIAREVLVPLANGASIPLGQVAKVKLVQGPASIRTENAQLAAYIYVDARDRDLGELRGRCAQGGGGESDVSPRAITRSGAASSNTTSAPSSV